MDLAALLCPCSSSGAILQYLGRKTSKFYPAASAPASRSSNGCSGRWRASGRWPVKPSFPELCGREVAYAIDRYTNEVNRLYGVMDTRLSDRPYLAGDYSIADMACFPWVRPYKNQGQDLVEFPALEAWFKRVGERPAVARAVHLGDEIRKQYNLAQDKEAQKILFGQRARRG